MGKNSAWQEYKKNLGSTRPWHLIDKSQPTATEEKSNMRFEICKSCPELIQITNQCKKCGCFMNLKTKLEKAVCPLGKW